MNPLEEVSAISVPINLEEDVSNSSSKSSCKQSLVEEKSSNLQQNSDAGESSDDKDDTIVIRKKKYQRFSDSESNEKDNFSDEEGNNEVVSTSGRHKVMDSEDNGNKIVIDTLQKSRIRKVSTSSDSESSVKESRIKNKRNKLKQKFESFVTSRAKELDASEMHDEINKKNTSSSDLSSNEAESIEKIKQIIKEKIQFKSTICDPDTSDEEKSPPKYIQKYKKARKQTIPTSPKPIRMSAKEAMENMQKIKSESNRMLREKEVSLPYHRPKALALKDILSRRRPAVTSDGKAMPLKMNEEQLKQYSMQLEQRQKEMMELCKSESEEEETVTNQSNTEEVSSLHDSVSHETKTEEMASLNDTMYDNLVEKSIQDNITVLDSDNLIDMEPMKTAMTENPPVEINNCFKNQEEVLKNSIHDNETQYNLEQLNSAPDLVLDSNTYGDVSLVYNNSVDDKDNSLVKTPEKIITSITDNCFDKKEYFDQSNCNAGTEIGSQLICLHYDSEKLDTLRADKDEDIIIEVTSPEPSEVIDKVDKHGAIDDFVYEDINMEDIDNLIENSEIIKNEIGESNIDSPLLVRELPSLKSKPVLTGAPGMVIDLDGTDPFVPKKLTGIELLKERFTYFSRLKTPEQLERDRENRVKPGMQHLKLKQELEDKIAEQRSLEWAKRLEEEKQKQLELDAIRGDGDDDIDKIEAKLEEIEDPLNNSSESEDYEDEPDELEEAYVDKPKKRNPLIADEAEESDCGDADDENEERNDEIHEEDECENNGDIEEEESEEDSSEDENSDDNQPSKPKKGRILKAFEDSDEEDVTLKLDEIQATTKEQNVTVPQNKDISDVLDQECNEDYAKRDNVPTAVIECNSIKDTEDDELELAQRHRSFSEDLFTSQESTLTRSSAKDKDKSVDDIDNKSLGTQTFSILNSTVANTDTGINKALPNTLTINSTQSQEEGNLDHIVAMCSGSFSQNLVTPQFGETQQSQDLGEDVLALCTGKFYDNQFVSQADNDSMAIAPISRDIVEVHDIDGNNEAVKLNILTVSDGNHKEHDDVEWGKGDNNHCKANESSIVVSDSLINFKADTNTKQKETEKKLLNSILEELNDVENEVPKRNKYFANDDDIINKENKQCNANYEIKKRFIIESDDEGNDNINVDKKKKSKKKKREKRVLQISDDEDDQSEEEDVDDYDEESEQNYGAEEVEYDSEENEIAVGSEVPKKKRKVADFFEKEAELTSEDEWIGSGDEDEADLDRMEREAGDDDTFNQNQLQKELGQIHMRDVLDQDKREVRLLQELLFEDGDLGDGHRQRKFRWNNIDGDDITDTANEFGDTQEEEFESEEQWRKQRHEREMFLKKLREEEDDTPKPNITRTSIIKANLISKTMSSLILDASTDEPTKDEAPVPEKKSVKDVPSPKKPFAIFQRNYHGSLLTRGRGALARLAALAVPIAGDEDAPKGSLGPSSKRNFVFATLTPDTKEPKIAKRKADSNMDTPKLVKKMRIEDKQKYFKNSILDHL